MTAGGFATRRQRAAGAVTPLNVYSAALAQQLRADAVTMGTGSGVASVLDWSAYALNASQGTATAQPTLSVDATLSNRPILTGDGTNDVLTSALACDLTTDDFYICAILRQNAWTSADKITSGPGAGVPRLTQSGLTPQVVQASTTAVNTNGLGVLGTWVRLEAFWSLTAGTSYLRIGATEVKTGNPGAGVRSSSSIFGAPTQDFWSGSIAEIYAVKRPAGSGGPTLAERAAVELNYLKVRYPTATY